MRRFAFSWSAAALVVLTGLTVVLVFAALRGPSGDGDVTPGPTGSALTDPPVDKKSTKAAVAGVADVEPLLSLVDQSTAFRGSVGTCLGGASLERTRDGGVTWEDVEAPVTATDDSLNAITELTARTTVVLSVVGADDSCRATSWSTSTMGREWNGPGATGGLWFRLPGSTELIQAPVGAVSNPCKPRTEAVTEIEALDDLNGVVLCPDGSVQLSADGGTSWTKQPAVDGAVALAWDTPAEGWLLQKGSDQCPGFVLLKTTNSGAEWLPGGCVGDGDDASPSANPPSLDFINPLIGMASLDGDVYGTIDGGVNWQIARATATGG